MCNSIKDTVVSLTRRFYLHANEFHVLKRLFIDLVLPPFQVDPNNPIITLPDGTTAQVVAAQGMATVSTVLFQASIL